MKFILAIALLVSSFFAHAVNIPNQTQITYYYFDNQKHEHGLSDMQMDLKWLKEPDSNWGYYAQFFFSFQAEVGGYTGLQQDTYSPEKKKAIFSIWDKTTGHKVRPISPWCKRFDWEGDGAQCIIQFKWEAGREYSFRVAKVDDGIWHGAQRWAAWVIDKTTEEVTLIGILEQPNYGNYHGFGNLATSNHTTTLEFYVGDRNASCANVPYFGLEWNGPYANHGTVTADHAVVNYTNGVGAHCENVSTVATGPNSTRQEIGRDIRPTNRTNDGLWTGFNKKRFNQLNCLFDWVEDTFPAKQGTTEAYRRLSTWGDSNYYRNWDGNGRGFKVVGVHDHNQQAYVLYDDWSYHPLGHVDTYLNNLPQCN